uniref:Uncharacterized protein n=1 Tax=Oryza brachyantha TaxID=4533 RepID=J3KVR1_ORYBR
MSSDQNPHKGKSTDHASPPLLPPLESSMQQMSLLPRPQVCIKLEQSTSAKKVITSFNMLVKIGTISQLNPIQQPKEHAEFATAKLRISVLLPVRDSLTLVLQDPEADDNILQERFGKWIISASYVPPQAFQQSAYDPQDSLINKFISQKNMFVQTRGKQAFIKTAGTIYKKVQDGVFDVSNESYGIKVGYAVPNASGGEAGSSSQGGGCCS